MPPHIKGPYVSRCRPYVFNKIVNEMLILIMEIQRINGGAEGLLEKQKKCYAWSVALSNSNKLE